MTFYTSLSGLANAQTDLDTIANNLANAQTTGFKQSSVNFADIVASSAYSNPRTVQGIGSTVKSIDQDFSSGGLESTGSALDLALNGQGFFTVTSPTSGNTSYTRNGSFSTDVNGHVIDQSKNRLQVLAYDSASGTYATTPSDATLPLTNGTATYTGVTVDTDGTMVASYSDASLVTVGKVALANFIAPTGLLQIGNQAWKATGLSGNASYGAPTTSNFGDIQSGALEQSNVDVSTQLVSLISAQQYFQANSKAISTQNTMISSIMNVIQG